MTVIKKQEERCTLSSSSVVTVITRKNLLLCVDQCSSVYTFLGLNHNTTPGKSKVGQKYGRTAKSAADKKWDRSWCLWLRLACGFRAAMVSQPKCKNHVKSFFLSPRIQDNMFLLRKPFFLSCDALKVKIVTLNLCHYSSSWIRFSCYHHWKKT